jgi:hypothetical protein
VSIAEQGPRGALPSETLGEIHDCWRQKHHPRPSRRFARLVSSWGNTQVPRFASKCRASTRRSSCGRTPESSAAVSSSRNAGSLDALRTDCFSAAVSVAVRRGAAGGGGAFDVGEGATIDRPLLLGPGEGSLYRCDCRAAAARTPLRMSVEPLRDGERLEPGDSHALGQEPHKAVQVAPVSLVALGSKVLLGPLAEHGQQVDDERVVPNFVSDRRRDALYSTQLTKLLPRTVPTLCHFGFSAKGGRERPRRKPLQRSLLRKSGRQDSNLRPFDPQSNALPGCATARPCSAAVKGGMEAGAGDASLIVGKTARARGWGLLAGLGSAADANARWAESYKIAQRVMPWKRAGRGVLASLQKRLKAGPMWWVRGSPRRSPRRLRQLGSRRLSARLIGRPG